MQNETGILQYFDINDRVKYDNYFVERSKKNQYKRLGPIGLKRRTREKIFGIECWVTSKEDFILAKLVFGGWQDFSDALGCWMRFKDYLDLSYLKEMSKNLRIHKELTLLVSGIEDPDEYFEKINGYHE